MWYKFVFNVWCPYAYIWARDKNCPVLATTVTSISVSTNLPSLVQWRKCCCKVGIPRPVIPQNFSVPARRQKQIREVTNWYDTCYFFAPTHCGWIWHKAGLKWGSKAKIYPFPATNVALASILYRLYFDAMSLKFPEPSIPQFFMCSVWRHKHS